MNITNESEYWESYYKSGFCIDGDFNAREHALYLKHFLQLFQYKVYSLGDYGFGKARLLTEVVKALKPIRVIAVEPYLPRVEDLKKKAWTKKIQTQIYHSKLEDFNPKFLNYAPLDLGICNSVVQYIGDEYLDKIIEKLAIYNKLLYFTVPTKNDYKRMEKKIGFRDPNAKQRKLNLYRKLIGKYFYFVSFNLLASRKYIEELPFESELFRF